MLSEILENSTKVAENISSITESIATLSNETLENSTKMAENMSTFTESLITLQDLNDEEARRRLAPMVYLGILILIGLPGNILALVTYFRKYKRSTHRTFILALAWVDLIGCAVCMPFEITEMNFQYTFYSAWTCKIFRFNNTFVTLSSIFIIMALSIDRFRRVCRPLKIQMTVKVAKIACVSALLLSVCLSWPILFYLGIRTVELKHNITGIDCSVSDAYWKTKYPFLHSAVLFVIFIFCIVCLIVLYSMIGRRIFSHVRFRSRFLSSKSTSSTRTTSTSVQGSQRSEHPQVELLQKTNNNEQRKASTATSTHSAPGNKEISDAEREVRKSRKITKIAFLIALMFILSFLPHLILTTITAVKGSFVAKPGPVVSALLPIVSRSIFINNMVNPLIYGFCDQKFRLAVISMFYFKSKFKK